MNNVDLLRKDETLKIIVESLSKEFPYCSITTDPSVYPLEDGQIDVVLIGVSVDDALACIRKYLPTYDLESADRGEFSVFICCINDEPFPLNLREVFGVG